MLLDGGSKALLLFERPGLTGLCRRKLFVSQIQFGIGLGGGVPVKNLVVGLFDRLADPFVGWRLHDSGEPLLLQTLDQLILAFGGVDEGVAARCPLPDPEVGPAGAEFVEAVGGSIRIADELRELVFGLIALPTCPIIGCETDGAGGSRKPFVKGPSATAGLKYQSDLRLPIVYLRAHRLL